MSNVLTSHIQMPVVFGNMNNCSVNSNININQSAMKSAVEQELDEILMSTASSKSVTLFLTGSVTLKLWFCDIVHTEICSQDVVRVI